MRADARGWVGQRASPASDLRRVRIEKGLLFDFSPTFEPLSLLPFFLTFFAWIWAACCLGQGVLNVRTAFTWGR